MITNIICAAIGIALFVAFIGTIVWWVKPIPLAIIAAGVIVAMIYDVVLSVREDGNR
ncbi:hypothetical protein [Desertibaculum subflavum]|uniref:hypothetical protein n=1 Tax=Desertibaculum subflavum TaxID=2268458 RepID=UPI0013C4C628